MGCHRMGRLARWGYVTVCGLFPIEGVGPDFAVVGASVRG